MKYFIFLPLIILSLLVNGQLLTDSVLVEGNYRVFHFNKPVEGIRSSLLFVLHGSGGSGPQIMKETGKLEAIASKEKLLIVYPDGYKRFWNECRRSSNALANTENVNENDFFGQMIRYFNKNYGIDEKKVFVAGVSGGGHMAYKLGLTMPTKIRGITAIIANLPDSTWSDCSEAKEPLPVLIINGTLDKTNPYDGGEMFVNNASFGVVKSTNRSFRYWAGLAGYEGEPIKKLLPDTDPNDNKTIESYTFKKTGKPEVTLLKVIGGKHDYPNDIDIFLFAWDFFKRQ